MFFVEPVMAAPSASVKLIKKQNVLINFSGISGLKSVSYELIYTNGNKEEGVVGVIRPKKDTESRNVYLGTCSKRACTPHRNIKTGTVSIKFKDQQGKTTTKKFKSKF